MNDTSESVQKYYQELIQNLPPSQRLAMCAEMMATAKSLMMSDVAHSSSVPTNNLREKLFQRLYSQDYSESEKKKILNHLRAAEQHPKTQTMNT